jgi:ferredoxin
VIVVTMNQSAHTVTLLDTGESFVCKSVESVLHGMARLGKRGIPVGCRGGGCGICKVQVVQGEYRKRVMSRSHVSASDEADDIVLACRISPASDLGVKALGAMQKAVARTVAWQHRERVPTHGESGN